MENQDVKIKGLEEVKRDAEYLWNKRERDRIEKLEYEKSKAVQSAPGQAPIRKRGE